SSTRLAPLAMTKTGRFVSSLRKIRDFAMCAISQPIASAASLAVRADWGSSIACVCMPNPSKACWNLWADDDICLSTSALEIFDVFNQFITECLMIGENCGRVLACSWGIRQSLRQGGLGC